MNTSLGGVRFAVLVLALVGSPGCDAEERAPAHSGEAGRCVGAKCDHAGETDGAAGAETKDVDPDYPCAGQEPNFAVCVDDVSVLCILRPDGNLYEDTVDCSAFNGCENGRCSCDEGQLGCWQPPEGPSIVAKCKDGIESPHEVCDGERTCVLHPGLGAYCLSREHVRDAALQTCRSAAFARDCDFSLCELPRADVAPLQTWQAIEGTIERCVGTEDECSDITDCVAAAVEGL